ncbi:hypothetical protein GQS_03355 [Thermococcus sp. 4557]|uniref:hypothetical protein n=1 Tax=Thermococcus sp. (strain CGMCC 1.5172 / 4557) TaxID=1042877 RepID=UPI000219E7AA|nr:hypothetical protein [Thermococcus sp. 4557]AEK72572.1 hypothetical protein GQS_03355 [Thermococcus sp. 4557]
MEMNVLEIFNEDRLSGAVVTVIYDAYSSAWRIPLLLLRRAIERGYFGIVSNYTGPLTNFTKRAGTVGLDVRTALERGDLAIIDLFGTRYNSRAAMPNVFYLDKVEPETINPKIGYIYETELGKVLSERTAFRLIYTLEGAALMLGEESTLKLLNQTLASRAAQLPNSTLVLPINRDVVSEKFVAWVAGVSDYVLLARSSFEPDGIKEYLYVISSPCEEFEPTAYLFRVTGGKGTEKLKVKKISP